MLESLERPVIAIQQFQDGRTVLCIDTLRDKKHADRDIGAVIDGHHERKGLSIHFHMGTEEDRMEGIIFQLLRRKGLCIIAVRIFFKNLCFLIHFASPDC